jgi:hypothetical protein
MKNAILLHIHYDGIDQRTYRDVAYEVLGGDGKPVRVREFSSGDPTRDWSDALHDALRLGLPIWRDHSCDDFVSSGEGYCWVNPKRKLVLSRTHATD